MQSSTKWFSSFRELFELEFQPLTYWHHCSHFTEVLEILLRSCLNVQIFFYSLIFSLSSGESPFCLSKPIFETKMLWTWGYPSTVLQQGLLFSSDLYRFTDLSYFILFSWHFISVLNTWWYCTVLYYVLLHFKALIYCYVLNCILCYGIVVVYYNIFIPVQSFNSCWVARADQIFCSHDQNQPSR